MHDTRKHSMRQLLKGPDPIFMPGCYDALSARMIAAAGFEATLISGFALEAGHLGGPDIGLMTLTELVDQARRITEIVDIPVIADVDTGFGGVQNIHRTVRLTEAAGLSGIHLEDQVVSKKCPLLPGRRVVSLEEAKDRYAVAVEARRSDDFIIIARTDSDILGYDEQVRRANEYLTTGADCVLPMMIDYAGVSFSTLPPDEQMRHISRAVRDIRGPMMFVGPPPKGYTAFDLADVGVKIICHAAITINAAATAMKTVLKDLREKGDPTKFFDDCPDRLEAGVEMLQLMDVDFYLKLERDFTTI